jgi:putative salt-induced outer membrane protein
MKITIKHTFFTPACLAFAITNAALADDSTTKPSFRGEVELGFVQTDGNSESTNISGKLKLEQETENWLHTASLSALNASSTDAASGDKSRTAERYKGELKSDRKLADHTYLYLLAGYEDDRFSGFEYQANVGLGVGYKVIDHDTTKLAFEAGPGYRYDKIRRVEGEGEPTIRIGEKFDWKFSDSAELNQSLSSEKGDDNTISLLTLAIKSTLTETLALKIGTELKYTEQVPTGKKHADRITFATINYTF